MSSDLPPHSPTTRDAVHYKMNHPKRGMALIFNHELFKGDWAPRRTGTNNDCDRLSESLKWLGFEVTEYHNLDYADIKKKLLQASGMDHTDNDCIVIAVMTHGELGTLHAHNHPYDINLIWEYFTADKCPTLAGKPKIFFIQACRGRKDDQDTTMVDHGTKLMERTETDCARIFSIPSNADFLMAYATIPGHYSWRIPSQGSWFITALCSELVQNGKNVHLLTLLTFVCRRVAIEFESDDPYDKTMDKKKQTPCITSMLTRLVQF